jgi:pimeloyl-ACP methyl ester carboxylesterase
MSRSRVATVPTLHARRATLVVVALVLATLVSGCGVFGGSGGDRADPQPSLTPSPIRAGGASSAGAVPAPSLRRFYAQKLHWRKCRESDLCARMSVPLDYTKPQGRAIGISVLKVPATSPAQRIGSLVVNPGGPGVSGVDFAAASGLGPELRRVFDVVGFDPRGVGESAPLHCTSTAQLDAVLASDPDPDTPAETKRSDALARQLGEGCVRRGGALAAHVSTDEVARDMDVLRATLGDPKLSYFGFSYGTLLGATYAGLFPQRVGRMVLDGAIDPSLSSVQSALVSAGGFETALRAYVSHCVDQGSCFLGSTVDQALARIRTFLADVDAKPLPASGTRHLTEGYAVLGIWQPLYYRSEWSLLDSSLKAAFEGNGAPLLSLADYYTDRGPTGFRDNSTDLLYAVNCLDHDDGIPSSQVPALLPRFEKVSGTWGRIFAYGLSLCAEWPVHSHHEPAPIHAAGSAPIMVVGTTRDPATPIEQARSLARQLDNAVLVTRNGDGHLAYHKGSSCVDTTIESYLVSGKVPPRAVHC